MATRRTTVSYNGDKETCNKQSSVKGKNSGTVVHAPIDKLGVPGRWLRHRILDSILVGTPLLLTIQRHRTPMRTIFMKTISFLGTEDFYTVLFLLLCWTMDSRLGRLFGILMGIGFYTTGMLKSALCLPRPPSPPVIPEEKAYDWALPSHHSLLGTILPWYIWLYVTVHYEMTSAQLTCIFLVIAFWSFSVLFSRLYLGVHSPADIVSGGFIGVIVLCLWLQIDDIVDSFISQQNIETPIQCILLFIGLLYIHPATDPGNPSFTDNCCLSGVVTGIILARSQRSRLLGNPSTLETLPPNSPLMTFLFIAAMRVVVGGALVFGLRTILKCVIKTSLNIIYSFLGLKYYSSCDYRKADHPQSKHYNANFLLPPIEVKKSNSEESEDEDSLSSTDSASCKEEGDSSDCSSFGKDMETELSDFQSYSLANLRSLSWDIDAPMKCIHYTILTYFAVEILPMIFATISL